jgi:hypothetical protein
MGRCLESTTPSPHARCPHRRRVNAQPTSNDQRRWHQPQNQTRMGTPIHTRRTDTHTPIATTTTHTITPTTTVLTTMPLVPLSHSVSRPPSPGSALTNPFPRSPVNPVCSFASCVLGVIFGLYALGFIIAAVIYFQRQKKRKVRSLKRLFSYQTV